MISSKKKYYVLKENLNNMLSWKVKRMQRLIPDFSRIDNVFAFEGNESDLLKKYIILLLGGFIQILSNYFFLDIKYPLNY